MNRLVAGCVVAAFAALAITDRAASARTVESASPPFRAQIPDSFHAMSGTRVGVQLFVAEGTAGSAPRVITFRPLEAPIAQEGLDLAAMQQLVAQSSPGARVRVIEASALGVSVPLVTGVSDRRDGLAIAQIPTEPRAVQLIVTGPAQDAASIERLARGVMASMTGQTRWLTRRQLVARQIARIAVVAAWASLALYGLAWALRFRRESRPSLQRALLAVIALLFATTAGALAMVPRHARTFDFVTPALVAAVLVANAVVMRSRSPVGPARDE